jgi:hypothetical protein
MYNVEDPAWAKALATLPSLEEMKATQVSTEEEE